MGRVYQSGKKGSECCLKPEEPKGLSSETFFGWEGDSPAYKGFCPHKRNCERSIYLAFCQSQLPAEEVRKRACSQLTW